MNAPTAESPVAVPFLPCEVCDDDPEKRQTCEACDYSGRLQLTGCPKKLAAGVWDAIAAVEMWRETGTPPEAGGQNDQTAAFMDAVDLLAWARVKVKEFKDGG